jgi:hypothetical protein
MMLSQKTNIKIDEKEKNLRVHAAESFAYNIHRNDLFMNKLREKLLNIQQTYAMKRSK